MLNWSLSLCQVRGIKLAVHFSFFILLAFAAYVGWQPEPETGANGGWYGVMWNVGILVAFFTCVVLHELGHSLTAMRFGVGVRRILLMPIGGMAEFDSIPRQPSRELLITFAGPAVNFVIAGALWALLQVPMKWPDTAPNVGPREFVEVLMYWNIVMGIFNLVPVFPMDGGRILRAFLASRLSYLRATRIAATIGKLLALAAIAVAVFAPELRLAPKPLWLMAVLFAFIFFAGEAEYRAVERREREDAQWREVLARFHATRRPLDEPPLLSP